MHSEISEAVESDLNVYLHWNEVSLDNLHTYFENLYENNNSFVLKHLKKMFCH